MNQIIGLGEQITEKAVVTKVLRSLTPKFDYVVASIEEAKDINKLTMDELTGSLQVYEERINRTVEK